MKKKLFFLFKLITLFSSFLIIVMILTVILDVKVDMSPFKSKIEHLAKTTLDREVKINGPIIFRFSNLTSIDVQDVDIKNVSDSTRSYEFHAKEARVEIDLISLLKGKIHFSEIIAENVTFNFDNQYDAEANLALPKSRISTESASEKKRMHFSGIDRVSFKNFTFVYYDKSLSKHIHMQFDLITGKMSPGKMISLDINGHVNSTPFHIGFESLPIEQLIDKTQLWSFNLDGEIGGKKVTAKGSFVDIDLPEVNMMFGVKDVDVGLILSSLGLVEGLSASADHISFKLAFKGSNLKQILEKSTMNLVVTEGIWKVTLFNGKNVIDINQLNGSISVQEGKNLTIDLSGEIEDEPLKLKISGAPLIAFIDKPDDIPLNVDAEFAKMKFKFDSNVSLPVSSRDINLTLQFSGERLDSVNQVLELDLPSIGPFIVDTQIHITDKAYDFSNVNVAIGKTYLNGEMNLDLTQKTPVVDMTLISDRIQINDFLLKKKNSKKISKEEREKIRKLLSKEVLGLIQGKVNIEAKEIYSGQDRIGAVSSLIELQDTRLTLNPLRLNFPGGIVDIEFSFFPKKHNNVIDLKANIDKFDIGILARRSKSETKMGGYLYLDAALHSITPNIQEMMKNANGHFDFGIIPKNFSADTIDLWAVNVITAIINRETQKDQSQVNCIIMRFGMENGLMQDKIVYMDTSTMTVAGESKIDFNKESIYVLMAPKAKKPKFFSLEVPIKINGSFKDFGMKLSKSGLVGSVISFITSPVIVPIKRALVDELPKDGEDACLKAWRYVEKSRVDEENLSTHEKNLKLLKSDDVKLY